MRTSSLGCVIYRVGGCVMSFRLWRSCVISSRYITIRGELRDDPRNTPTLFPTPCSHRLYISESCISSLSVCYGFRIGSPVSYSAAHSVLRFTQPKAFDRSISIIFVLGVPAWMACSICRMPSIADIPLLCPNWLLGVGRFRILSILLFCSLCHIL